LNRTQLYNGFGRNTSMKDLGSALASLQEKRKVYAMLDNTTGGRPAERWYPGSGLRQNAITPKATESPGDTLSALRRNGVSPPGSPEQPTPTVIVQPTLEPAAPEPGEPEPIFPDAKAWVRAVYDAGGRIDKQDDGSCVLSFPDGTPEEKRKPLDAEAQRWLADACKEFKTHAEFWAQLKP
jgi:hypothetical protein